MAMWLKQSTAVDVLIGPFVDSTDGYTSEEALSPSVELSKNGQALAAKNDATTPVVDDLGYYNCELDAIDTNTLGQLVLAVEGSATHLPVRHEFLVVPANTYDAMVAGTDNIDANTVEWAGSATASNDTALATAPTNFASLAIAAADGRVEANVEEVGGTNVTSSGGVLEVNLAQWLGTAPLALSSQRVQTLVGAMAADVVTSSAIATDAIGSAELAASAVTEITDDIMAEVVESQGSYTVQQVLSIILAVLAGETSGGGVTIATPNGVATRVAATVDASNNRTAMTLTPSS